jgi:hypothetical protein
MGFWDVVGLGVANSLGTTFGLCAGIAFAGWIMRASNKSDKALAQKQSQESIESLRCRNELTKVTNAHLGSIVRALEQRA